MGDTIATVLKIATQLASEIILPLLEGEEDFDELLDKPVREIISRPLRSEIALARARAQALAELEGEDLAELEDEDE
jgi:hypothetical protein